MKKMLLFLLLVILLAAGGFFGYSFYQSSVSAEKEIENREKALSHFGEITYEEGGKPESRFYAANILTPIYRLVGLNMESYNLLMERIRYGEIKYDALNELIDDQIVVYQLVRDFHETFPIPSEMREVHEELLVGLYEFSKANELIDSSMDQEDFDAVEEHINKMLDIVNSAPDKNEYLKWNRVQEQFDYLTNQQ